MGKDFRNGPPKNSRMNKPTSSLRIPRLDLGIAASNRPAPAEPAASAPRLLDRLRAEIRTRHYSIRTEHAHVERRELIARDGKDGKDRVTVLPEDLMMPLRDQLAHDSGVGAAKAGRRQSRRRTYSFRSRLCRWRNTSL